MGPTTNNRITASKGIADVNRGGGVVMGKGVGGERLSEAPRGVCAPKIPENNTLISPNPGK